MVNKKQLQKQRRNQLHASTEQQSGTESDRPVITDNVQSSDKKHTPIQASSYLTPEAYNTSRLNESLSTIISEDALPPHTEPNQLNWETKKPVTNQTQIVMKQEVESASSSELNQTQDQLQCPTTQAPTPPVVKLERNLQPYNFERLTVSEHTGVLVRPTLQPQLRTPVLPPHSESKVDKWMETTHGTYALRELEPQHPFTPGTQLLLPLDLSSSTNKDGYLPSTRTKGFVRPRRNKSLASSSSAEGSIRSKIFSSQPAPELKLHTEDSKRKRRSSSSQSTPIEEKLSPHKRRGHLREAKDINKTLRSDVNPFEILIEELNLERVFYDPELDILNRFCLEYTELCQQTLKKGIFTIRQLPHHIRVYDSMRKATEDASTPVVDGSPPVSIPMLHYGLFLDHFRASSTRIKDPKIPLPHFTQGHRLTENRFLSIIQGIFDRRQYLASSVGVSQQLLSNII